MTDIKHDKKVNKKMVTNDQQKSDKECEHIRTERDEYKQKYLRALADYQNFEKRVEFMKKELVSNANKGLLLRLLSFLDNLEKAEIFVKDSNLQMIKSSFIKVLSDEGLKEIEVLGKEFDPYTSEAIDIVPGERENTVIEVFRKGYMLNDAVIRIAQVKVSKKS